MRVAPQRNHGRHPGPTPASRIAVPEVRTDDRRRCASRSKPRLATWLHSQASMMNAVAKVRCCRCRCLRVDSARARPTIRIPTLPPERSDPNDPNDPGGGGSTMTAPQFLDAMGHKDCDGRIHVQDELPADAGVTFARRSLRARWVLRGCRAVLQRDGGPGRDQRADHVRWHGRRGVRRELCRADVAGRTVIRSVLAKPCETAMAARRGRRELRDRLRCAGEMVRRTRPRSAHPYPAE